MNLSWCVDFLLQNACVNTRYIVNRDFKGISVNEPFMQRMQEEILRQKNAQKVFAIQHDDGWFGHELHGGPGSAMEGVHYLIMLGVEPGNEKLQKAKRALLDPDISMKHNNYFAGGDALDADGRGGNRAVAAGILAALGEDEGNALIADEINLALCHFKGALQHNSIDDFTIVANDKAKTRYYKPNALFPGANHIGILARTSGWRTKENVTMITESIEHCIGLMKDAAQFPTFKKRPPYGSGFVGPFNFNWHAFNVKDFECFSEHAYRFGYAFWMRTLIGFGKLGIAGDIPAVKKQYLLLAELLETDRLYEKLSENAKKGFRHVSSIEPSWKNEINIKCDIYFSALVAIHNAGLCESGKLL